METDDIGKLDQAHLDERLKTFYYKACIDLRNQKKIQHKK